MIVTATELATESKRILDRVVHGGRSNTRSDIYASPLSRFTGKWVRSGTSQSGLCGSNSSYLAPPVATAKT